MRKYPFALFLLAATTTEGGGGDAKPESDADKIKRLEAENEILKKAKEQTDADEKMIVEKMVHGLTREQAIHVIGRQKDRDAAKARRKAIQAIADKSKTPDAFLAELKKQFPDATDAEKQTTPTPPKPAPVWK